MPTFGGPITENQCVTISQWAELAKSGYRAWKGLTPEAEAVVLQDYHDDGSGKAPRYYQVNAINAAIESIAKGADRILLVMATGTGKTYTAFQIIWRLWKAGRKKRILFLADRNVLVDQTMVNDFRPFGPAMAKLSTKAKTIERADGSSGELTSALDGRRRIDTAYEIYLGLYQAITGPEEHQKIFREFSPGFFDLIVIDECHRGSAAEDSAWREILEYFSSATQIGLTATPKETRYVSNIDYFGPPVYTYSLKQGIRDGFLAPYKVVKVHIDRDVEGYRPEKGQLDRDGNEVEDRIYNTRDFDRVLVLDERTRLVARKVTAFLKESGNRFQKAIVFCVDQEHAGCMRQALINENADLVDRNHRYVMRITGNDQQGHPTGYAAFSTTDDDGDARLLPMIRGWVEADIAHGSAVMLPDGVMFGRVLRSGGVVEPIDCIAVAGDDLLFWYADSGGVGSPSFAASEAQVFGDGTIERMRQFLARLHPFREEPNATWAAVEFSLASMDLFDDPDEGICELMAGNVGKVRARSLKLHENQRIL